MALMPVCDQGEIMTVISRIVRTVSPIESITFNGANTTYVKRQKDFEGKRKISILRKNNPNDPTGFLLNGRIVTENEPYQLDTNVRITVMDASSQSRVKVLIEAPLAVKVKFTKVAPEITVPDESRTVITASLSYDGVESFPLPAKSLFFRTVLLPYEGCLDLHAMPGRYGPLQDTFNEITRLKISQLVCLVSLDEIQDKSLKYAEAIELETVPCQMCLLPVHDFGVPDDHDAYLAKAAEIASSVKGGHRILVHCAGGIGRTGCFAITVLMHLGYSLESATKTVKLNGSGPENPMQKEFLKTLSQRIV